MLAKTPSIKEVAWISLVPQLGVMALLFLGAARTVDSAYVPWVGAGAYLLLSQGLRRTIASAHRRGVRLMKRGDFENAIPAFHESYRFFSDHPWVDRARYLTLLSSSAYSYREMALCNIAFGHAQLGRREEAISWYRRALQEFPDCALARTSLAVAGDGGTISR